MPARFSEHTGFIGYDDEFKAEEVRLTLRKLQKDYLVDMEEAVVAVKNAKGKVRKTSRKLWICQPGGSGRAWSALSETWRGLPARCFKNYKTAVWRSNS